MLFLQERLLMEKKLIEWDLAEVSKALQLTEVETKEYFTDGRRVSFMIERRLAKILGGTLAPSEGASFDLLDSEGKKWEVRSLTKGGIYFCPSYMVGSGRAFEEKGFLKKLQEIKGYLISDITKFPKVPYWSISSEKIKELYLGGHLGSTTKITRKIFFETIIGA